MTRWARGLRRLRLGLGLVVAVIRWPRPRN